MEEETICLQCGDRGFTNAFVYCVKCLKFAVHRYCLDVIPNTLDEFVHWVCHDCKAKVQSQFSVHKRDDSPSPTRDHKVSRNIEQFYGNETDKNDLVVVQTQTDEPFCKDGPKEEKVEANPMQQIELAATSRKKTIKKKKKSMRYTMKKRRRDVIEKFSTEKDQQSQFAVHEHDDSPSPTRDHKVPRNIEQLVQTQTNKPVYKDGPEEEKVEANPMQQIELPASSRKKTIKKKKKKKTRYTTKKRKRNVIEKSSTHKDQQKLGKTSTEQSYEERMEVDVNGCTGLVSESTLPSNVKENKGSEQSDQTCNSRQSSDSDTDPGMVEHPVISCNGPSSCSKKQKTVELSIPNMQKKMDLAVATQPLHETKRLDLGNQCADLSTEERKLGSSNDRIESREPEDKQEGAFATSRASNVLDISAAKPVLDPIWRGSFSISNKKYDKLDDVLAHISSKACQKVFEAASQFQPWLEFEMLPRSEVWPKSFETSNPSGDNIALYFFPSNISERFYDYLVEKMMTKELALKAVVQNAELLIFTSVELPLGYWTLQDFKANTIYGEYLGEKQSPSSQSHSSRGEMVETPSIEKGCGEGSPLSPLSNSASCGSTSSFRSQAMQVIIGIECPSQPRSNSKKVFLTS